MSAPDIDLLVGDERHTPHINWRTNVEGELERLTAAPVIVPRTDVETSLVVVWRGELWPKWNVEWHSDGSSVSAETLGNKLLLRLSEGAGLMLTRSGAPGEAALL
jgi:hypothetical protein